MNRINVILNDNDENYLRQILVDMIEKIINTNEDINFKDNIKGIKISYDYEDFDKILDIVDEKLFLYTMKIKELKNQIVFYKSREADLLNLKL